MKLKFSKFNEMYHEVMIYISDALLTPDDIETFNLI